MKKPADLLLQWYATEARDLPWRKTKDPYKIWLSEIILQQTRIDQGRSYYERFVQNLPTVKDLALIDTDTLMKYWEGLGYYSRARNLHHTAKAIHNEYGGIFPDSWEELLKLKGIGPYTARAIGSLAFDNQVAVLDGNVFRVYSRYTADFSPIDLPATRKSFQSVLDTWVVSAVKDQKDPQAPGKFNQAMMDLGATICTPRNPSCSLCPLESGCQALSKQLIGELPKKAKKLKRKTVWQHFFLLHTDSNKILVRRRPATGLWPNLWELPNAEVEEKEWQKGQLDGLELRGAFKHVFTHIDMMIKIYEGQPENAPAFDDCKAISIEEIKDYAFSRAVLKIFERYLSENS